MIIEIALGILLAPVILGLLMGAGMLLFYLSPYIIFLVILALFWHYPENMLVLTVFVGILVWIMWAQFKSMDKEGKK